MDPFHFLKAIFKWFLILKKEQKYSLHLKILTIFSRTFGFLLPYYEFGLLHRWSQLWNLQMNSEQPLWGAECLLEGAEALQSSWSPWKFRALQDLGLDEHYFWTLNTLNIWICGLGSGPRSKTTNLFSYKKNSLLDTARFQHQRHCTLQWQCYCAGVLRFFLAN